MNENTKAREVKFLNAGFICGPASEMIRRIQLEATTKARCFNFHLSHCHVCSL